MLNYITFYDGVTAMKQELNKFQQTLPEKTPIKINFSSGICEIGSLRLFHKVLTPDIQSRMQGVRWHGYLFDKSIRTVDTDFVHWLNEQVARNHKVWTS